MRHTPASVMVRAMQDLPPSDPRGRAALALAALALLVMAALLGGCGSAPRPGRDGPPPSSTVVPAEASRGSDAEPRIEPLRTGGPNKPYEVLGRSYTPEQRDVPIRETGIASWYGRQFDGRRTANGEIFDMYAMTAAHKTMPLPSYARVRNPANGREIVVRVNDRGPFVDGRIIDLSYGAAQRLGVAGVAQVEVERLTFEDIRTGAWRRGAPPSAEAPVTLAGSAAAPTLMAPPAPRVPTPSVAMSARRMPAAPMASATPPLTTAPATPSPEAPTEAGLAFAIALMGSDGARSVTEPSAALPVPATAPPAAPPSAGAATPAPSGFWIQLGAFRERPGAESFQQRIAADLDWLAPRLAVFDEAPLLRLQAGPYASREEAQSAAQRVREALQLVPVVVERR